MKARIMGLWSYLAGKKTIIVGFCAVIYGMYENNTEAVLLGLGFLGLRDGLKNEVGKILTKKSR